MSKMIHFLLMKESPVFTRLSHEPSACQGGCKLSYKHSNLALSPRKSCALKDIMGKFGKCYPFCCHYRCPDSENVSDSPLRRSKIPYMILHMKSIVEKKVPLTWTDPEHSTEASSCILTPWVHLSMEYCLTGLPRCTKIGPLLPLES